MLIAGGFETTRNSMTSGLLAFIRNQEQIRLLQSDPQFLSQAVEETFRWASPAMIPMRTAMRDTELGGKTIKRGERVVVWTPAVKGDPAVFETPHRFDIDRWPNRHFAFGSGPHVCIGSMLSRMGVALQVPCCYQITGSA